MSSLYKNISDFINSKYLNGLVDLNNEYKNNYPFPHIVLDDFFNKQILENIFDDLSILSDQKKVDFENNIKKKISFENVDDFPENIRKIFYFLNSGQFLNWMNHVSGIKEKLIADPDFFGGGVHKCFKGGYLKVHTDYHKHPTTHLDRRINALVYLNQNWIENYGGHLELFDKNNLTESKKKILPIFNRFVAFSTTDVSFHGHPDPLSCPDEKQRYAIATWYYSNGRDDVNKSFLNRKNTTFWVNRDHRDNIKNQRYTFKDYLKKFSFFRNLKKVLNKK